MAQTVELYLPMSFAWQEATSESVVPAVCRFMEWLLSRAAVDFHWALKFALYQL